MHMPYHCTDHAGGEDEITFDPDDIIENIEQVCFHTVIVLSVMIVLVFYILCTITVTMIGVQV